MDVKKNLHSLFCSKKELRKILFHLVVTLVLFVLYYFVFSPQIHLKGNKTNSVTGI